MTPLPRRGANNGVNAEESSAYIYVIENFIKVGRKTQ